MKFTTQKIAAAAVVAAVYAALSFVLAPISYGPIQFRVSEVMCVLPFFFPFATWGLFCGCILANLLSAYGLLDIIFGSLATLLAGLCTMSCRKIRPSLLGKLLACLPPILFNGVIIGAVIAYTTTPDVFWAGFVTNGAQVAGGEAAVLFLLGLPTLIWLPKTAFFSKLQSHLE